MKSIILTVVIRKFNTKCT